MTVYDVLELMMKVPHRAKETAWFEIDTFLSPRNPERLRALALVKRSVPPAIHDAIGYMHTQLDTEKSVKWLHGFIVHQAEKIGWDGTTYFETPCLIKAAAMRKIVVTAHYNDPETRISYTQDAEFYPRRNEVSIGQVKRRRMHPNEPLK